MESLSLNELAAEGERLCKLGECHEGLSYFEEALKCYDELMISAEGDKDEQEQAKLLQVISIIYNQMGNAYFYLQDYENALVYHKKDLELSDKFNDECGKAKACGNIGNTLQLLGDYDEAILYSLRNLEISNKLNDTSGEARALYNLGNIYQSKGKHMGRITFNTEERDPNRSDFPDEIKEVLLKAIFYYRKTLEIVTAKDRAAEGRTYGNLGNTYYLMGDFESAIDCHGERLKIAKEYGDKAAERRAYSNLGNCHIFLGRFIEASDFYLKAMNVARTLGDKAIEAQSYYSLGNAYILIQDYSVAIDFHLRHLQIAQLLEDRVGEARAYWSLGNAYAAYGDLDNAIMYANRHLNLAQAIGDTSSQLTAKKNLYDFQSILHSNSGFRDSESGLFTPVCSKYGRKYLEKSNTIHKSASIDSFYTNTALNNQANNNVSKLIAGNIEGPNGQKKNLNNSIMNLVGTNRYPDENNDSINKTIQNKDENNTSDASFFEILTKAQSSRLDDQRCTLNILANKTNMLNISINSNNSNSSTTSSTNSENLSNKKNNSKRDFFNFILKSQRSNKDDDQRSSISSGSSTSSGGVFKNGLFSSKTKNSQSSSASDVTNFSTSRQISTESFNRASFNSASTPSSLHTNRPSKLNNNNAKTLNHPIKMNGRQAITLPTDDAFFSMVQKVQSRRLDEQRTNVKSASVFKRPF